MFQVSDTVDKKSPPRRMELGLALSMVDALKEEVEGSLRSGLVHGFALSASRRTTFICFSDAPLMFQY